MDSTKIISLKQELLKKETEQNDLISKLKGKQKMKTYSLIAIPILFLLGVIFMSIEERNGDSYYTTKPYEGAGLLTFLIFIPIAIALAIFGFIKSKKLKQPVKEGANNIMKIKNELIVLENTK